MFRQPATGRANAPTVPFWSKPVDEILREYGTRLVGPWFVRGPHPAFTDRG